MQLHASNEWGIEMDDDDEVEPAAAAAGSAPDVDLAAGLQFAHMNPVQQRAPDARVTGPSIESRRLSAD